MKTKAMKKIISVLLVCVMLVGALAGLGVFAAEAEPTIEIVSNNVWFGETLYPMYDVATTGNTDGYEIVVKVTVNGKEYTCVEYYAEELERNVYVAPYGVAAQNINAEYTATPYLVKDDKEIKGTEQNYSVLEYINERLYVSANTTADEKTMLNALNTYAIAADAFLNKGANGIGDYVYVNVTGSSENKTGMYKKGEPITLTADKEPADGMKIVWSVYDVDGVVKATVDNGEIYMVDNYTAFITYEEVEDGANIPTLLATFALGANGSASHNDGSDATSYSEKVNGYTLNITSGTKMYKGARDAKGNSCLKFGTGSVAGSMTFTVPENVTEVKIYVAKYKANTTKITVNGAAHTLTKNSDNGAYDVITVDTSVNKTVSFATVSGGLRAMMNTIEFIGCAN